MLSKLHGTFIPKTIFKPLNGHPVRSTPQGGGVSTYDHTVDSSYIAPHSRFNLLHSY